MFRFDNPFFSQAIYSTWKGTMKPSQKHSCCIKPNVEEPSSRYHGDRKAYSTQGRFRRQPGTTETMTAESGIPSGPGAYRGGETALRSVIGMQSLLLLLVRDDLKQLGIDWVCCTTSARQRDHHSKNLQECFGLGFRCLSIMTNSGYCEEKKNLLQVRVGEVQLGTSGVVLKRHGKRDWVFEE